MNNTLAVLSALTILSASAWSQTQPVTIEFRAVVGSEDFACGRSYSGIGTTRSRITPKDFRLYVHSLRLIDEKGVEVPIDLEQDGKWQFDDVALLDFESGSGGCSNGNVDMNMEVSGTVPAGHKYRGLRFAVGVPFNKNHTDLTAMPSPLNLTALNWSWNAGRKFARIEFASTGRPTGYVLHLGSTGCMPKGSKTTPATSCAQPNRPEIALRDFDPANSVVVADLAALLKDSNVDTTNEKFKSGCMSSVNNPDCAPLFANLGLPFGDQPARQPTFFRTGSRKGAAMSAGR